MANISKLTSDQISEMRRLFEEGATQKSLAARYNVSTTTIVNKLKKPMLDLTPVGPGRTVADLLPDSVYPRPERKTAADHMQEAFNMTPEELGQAAVDAVKKKEPPKRRIVGVNI